MTTLPGKISVRLDVAQPASDPFVAAREAMVEIIAARGVDDQRVLEAMRLVPRHELVPAAYRGSAYEDRPLPIGAGQSISQPYMVAFMTEAAGIGPGDKVLEVGTGSGYQAAVLAVAGAEVFSVEIVPALAERAKQDLGRLGLAELMSLREGDGHAGWSQEAPFQAIVVTAAPEEVPERLLWQLADGGRLVIPVGPAEDQWLLVHTRRGRRFDVERVFPVRFVPMTHA